MCTNWHGRGWPLSGGLMHRRVMHLDVGVSNDAFVWRALINAPKAVASDALVMLCHTPRGADHARDQLRSCLRLRPSKSCATDPSSLTLLAHSLTCVHGNISRAHTAMARGQTHEPLKIRIHESIPSDVNLGIWTSRSCQKEIS